MIVPCLVLIVLGVSLLPVVARHAPTSSRSAVLFGIGFGSAYPIFVAHLMHHVPDNRRGATFGALIGAFDTGIGTGSIAIGWMSEHYGFSRAFAVAAVLALALDSVLPDHGETTVDDVRPGATGLKVLRLCLGSTTRGAIHCVTRTGTTPSSIARRQSTTRRIGQSANADR